MSELAEEGVIEQVDEAIIEGNEAVVEDGNTAPVEDNEDIIDEIEISIGDESLTSEEDDSTAPAWVKTVREQSRTTSKDNRKLSKRVKEQEQEILNLKSGRGAESPEAPTKPTFEGCDYDEDKFENAISVYKDWERGQSEKLKVQQGEVDEQEKAWTSKLDNYETSRNELKVKHFEEAEDVVRSTLSDEQRGYIIDGASNPALLVYAIGRDPKRAEELSKIKNHTQFIFALAKLEKDVKVTKKRPTPPPEGKITGSASSGSAANSTLDRLREEAVRTNSITKVMAYKRQMKNKS